MPTKIYFVRHGKSENPDRINYGRMPGYPLSDEGESQAGKAARFFANKNIKSIYTSPLERSYQTANIIAKVCPGATIEHVFDLNEVDSTNWQGMKVEELFTNTFYETFLNNPDAGSGTENLNAVADRMQEVVNNILEKNKGGAAVAISHEFPILALKMRLEKKPLQGIKTYHLPMGGILEFEFDDTGAFVKSTEINV